MENRNFELAKFQGKVIEALDNLKQDIAELKCDVKKLMAFRNKLIAIASMAGFLGAIVIKIISRYVK